MSGYLLDTNIVSELRKGAKANKGVVRFVAETADEELYLSVLVLGEIRTGIERLRKKDAGGARALARWLAALQSGFAERLLPIDKDIADTWGHIEAVRSRSVVDALMAATARTHGLTMVTRNEHDFLGTDVKVRNPFE